MSRLAFILSASCILIGCAGLTPIEVVETAPMECTFLKELSYNGACDPHGEVFVEDVEIFRRLARNIGADTIECCRISDEVAVLQSCEVRQRFARAYRCKRPQNK